MLPQSLAVDKDLEAVLMLAAGCRAVRYVQGQPLGDESCGILPSLALGEVQQEDAAPSKLPQPVLFGLAA